MHILSYLFIQFSIVLYFIVIMQLNIDIAFAEQENLQA